MSERKGRKRNSQDEGRREGGEVAEGRMKGSHARRGRGGSHKEYVEKEVIWAVGREWRRSHKRIGREEVTQGGRGGSHTSRRGEEDTR